MLKEKPKTTTSSIKPKPSASKRLNASKNHSASKPPKRVTKTSVLLTALQQKHGATIAELMAVADWQSHSVRGFLSTLGKKPGYELRKFTRADGETGYAISETQQ